MRPDLAELVYPVFREGLRLKERLKSGEALEWHREQARLKDLLLSDTAAQDRKDFGSDAQGVSWTGTLAGDSGRCRPDQFLGVRYALACWLDEIFILDSPWAGPWSEHRLEWALYQSNDRAWLFWEQARLAEDRPAADALEAFYLCVMLGFRGDYREDRAELKAWAARTATRLAAIEGPVFPPGKEPTPNVPPIHGGASLQRMILVAAACVLVVLPLLAFALVRTLLAAA
jgi:type IV/VI secretion system ImpK/VasF family protein